MEKRLMRSTPATRLAVRFGAPALGALTALSLLGFTAQAHAANRSAGHVYVLDNPAAQNSISVYNRSGDGLLSYASTTLIGGLGTGDPLGSQGSLTLAGDRLFAVDGGSDQISVVETRDGALSLDGVFSSLGALPVSVTYRDGFLYVVNSGAANQSANVVGFTVGEHGALTPIAGADVALSAALPGPAQVALSPDGETLAVTEKTTNLVDTFHVADDGSLSDRVSVASTGQTPFGFSFNPVQPHELVVADAAGGATGASAISVYHVGEHGAKAQGGAVADHQTAACWLIITGNGKFAYATNAGSGTISGYRLWHGGGASLLNADGLTASTGAASHPLEMALTPNSRYLYALDAGTHTLSGFAVARDGRLAAVNLAGVTLTAGAVGLAAD
jgi:6-phosphogluconolactonase